MNPSPVVAAIMVNTSPQATTSTTATRIPPLESGDRLTRYEFERRYHAMLRVKKAETIALKAVHQSAIKRSLG